MKIKNTNELKGERGLSTAVILQAVEDAKTKNPCSGCKYKKKCKENESCNKFKQWRMKISSAKEFFSSKIFDFWMSFFAFDASMVEEIRKNLLSICEGETKARGGREYE